MGEGVLVTLSRMQLISVSLLVTKGTKELSLLLEIGGNFVKIKLHIFGCHYWKSRVKLLNIEFMSLKFTLIMMGYLSGTLPIIMLQ